MIHDLEEIGVKLDCELERKMLDAESGDFNASCKEHYCRLQQYECVIY